MWWILAMFGCGGAPAECGAAECADVCATTAHEGEPAAGVAPKAGGGALTLTAFEQSLLQPKLDDLRKGVRPRGDQGIGICKGQTKDCTEFIGTSAEELPAGEYMLHADLDVPDIGEKGTWKVRLDLDCTTTKTTANGSNSSNSTQQREYDVVHTGADRGYHLAPLWKIESPNKYGASDCKYKITAPHADGDKVYEGSWKVPAAG